MAGVRTQRSALIWMTCARDGREHAVPDAELGAGVSRGRGVYRALCRVEVLAPAMTAPPGRRCPACTAELAARPDRTSRLTGLRRWFAALRST